MTIRELRELVDDAGFVTFLLLLPGVAALAIREHFRLRRSRKDAEQRLLNESFRRAKKLDPWNDSQQR